jgi:hypothetical protein
MSLGALIPLEFEGKADDHRFGVTAEAYALCLVDRLSGQNSEIGVLSGYSMAIIFT